MVAVAVIVGVAAWSLATLKLSSSAATRTSHSGHGATPTTVPAYFPAAIAPVVTPALHGEGRWIAKDHWHVGAAHVMTTWIRTDRSNHSTMAYLSWIRSSSTRLGLYLGYEGPGPSNLNRGPEAVPSNGRWNLLATFNSGFYEKDASAGFYTHGVLYFPMIKYLATVVQYTNGTLDIINWPYGARPPANVLMARQNLRLLVSHAQVTPGSATNSLWGVTLGGVPAVWRTGLGVDANGNLIYVAAGNQTSASLARILQHAGAVRAMQLDINPEWPIFVTYGGPNAGSPQLEVPNPHQIPTRFLYTSTKDFFAIYARVNGKLQTPW